MDLPFIPTVEHVVGPVKWDYLVFLYFRSTQKRSINIYNADDNEVSGSESAIRYVKFFHL